MTKTFYSVKFSGIGFDSPRTVWFDDKAKAESFAAHDYRDDVRTHRCTSSKTIREYEELVSMNDWN